MGSPTDTWPRWQTPPTGLCRRLPGQVSPIFRRSSPSAPPEFAPSWDVFGDVRRGSSQLRHHPLHHSARRSPSERGAGRSFSLAGWPWSASSPWPARAQPSLSRPVSAAISAPSITLHTDNATSTTFTWPYVHVGTLASGLNSKKADLELWRQTFAQALRDRGGRGRGDPKARPRCHPQGGTDAAAENPGPPGGWRRADGAGSAARPIARRQGRPSQGRTERTPWEQRIVARQQSGAQPLPDAGAVCSADQAIRRIGRWAPRSKPSSGACPSPILSGWPWRESCGRRTRPLGASAPTLARNAAGSLQLGADDLGPAISQSESSWNLWVRDLRAFGTCRFRRSYRSCSRLLHKGFPTWPAR